MRVRWAVAAVTALIAAGCGDSDKPAHYAATVVIPGASRAPDFTLHDDAGRAVRLSDFRGRAVLLTFVYTHCPDVCPLIVGNLRAALRRLGARATKAHVVAVSVDPRGDTPRAVARFVRAHGMQGHMTYLIGARRELAPVWRAYGIAVRASPEQRETGHTASVFGITASGRRRVYYAQDFAPAAVAHDVPQLAAE
jgi:protein SCO1/2